MYPSPFLSGPLTRSRNPLVYRTALTHLSLAPTPDACALVAAHMFDLRAAAVQRIRTGYVRRATEDADERRGVRAKAHGGRPCGGLV